MTEHHEGHVHLTGKGLGLDGGFPEEAAPEAEAATEATEEKPERPEPNRFDHSGCGHAQSGPEGKLARRRCRNERKLAEMKRKQEEGVVDEGCVVPNQIVRTQTVVDLTKLHLEMGQRVKEILAADPLAADHYEMVQYLDTWPRLSMYFHTAYHDAKIPEISLESVEESMREQYQKLLAERGEGPDESGIEAAIKQVLQSLGKDLGNFPGRDNPREN